MWVVVGDEGRIVVVEGDRLEGSDLIAAIWFSSAVIWVFDASSR